MRSLLIRPIQAGFTLVELLIVVIIVAILAAIVVPQFTTATADAQEAALDANLASLRSAIELYRVQHNSVYPGVNAASGGTCPGGAAAGTGAAGSAEAFRAQLTMYSNASGQTCTLGDGTFRFGPYMRRMPSDPVIGSDAIAITATGALPTPTTATGGWAYALQTGQIGMNHNGNDSRTRPYSTH